MTGTDDFDTMLRRMITEEERAAPDRKLSAAIRRKARLAGALDEAMAGQPAGSLDVIELLDLLRQQNVALELTLKALATRRQKG